MQSIQKPERYFAFGNHLIDFKNVKHIEYNLKPHPDLPSSICGWVIDLWSKNGAVCKNVSEDKESFRLNDVFRSCGLKIFLYDLRDHFAIYAINNKDENAKKALDNLYDILHNKYKEYIQYLLEKDGIFIFQSDHLDEL